MDGWIEALIEVAATVSFVVVLVAIAHFVTSNWSWAQEMQYHVTGERQARSFSVLCRHGHQHGDLVSAMECVGPYDQDHVG